MKLAARGTPNASLRRQRLERGWSLRHVADELCALCEEEDGACSITADMIGKWERGIHRPSPFYREKLCRLYGLSAAELGFINIPRLSASQGHVTIEDVPSRQSIPLPEKSVVQELEAQDMDKSRRKLLLEETPRLIGVALAIPSYSLLNASLLERLSRAVTKPSSIDETTLRYLEKRTDDYWQDRHSAALASYDLLSYVLEHLQKVTILLEGSLLPSMRMRLCSIASGTAQLMGTLLFDIGDYRHARDFHIVAIQAAQEANNRSLEAVAWTRLSYSWTYDNNPQAALPCIQEACRLAAGSANTIVCASLAATEAEIQAILGERLDCFKALDIAENIEEQQIEGDNHWLHFDHSRWLGFQGACFRRLYCVDDARTHFFLNDAHRALTEAVAQLAPSLIQRQPTLKIDLASICIQQEEIEEACSYMIHAATVTARTKSLMVTQRLIKLRHLLDQWADTEYVQALDAYMLPLLTRGQHQGNL